MNTLDCLAKSRTDDEDARSGITGVGVGFDQQEFFARVDDHETVVRGGKSRERDLRAGAVGVL
jgi:hypothetical protein